MALSNEPMKKFITICICLLALFGLIGCKTTKKAVSESSTTTREETDTTKLATDSIHVGTIRTNHRTTLTYFSDWGYIEFTDSGGTLTIDTLGNLKAKGVKSYQHGKKATQKKAVNTTQSKDSTGTHRLQANGVQSKDSTGDNKLQANGVQSRDNKQTNRETQKQGVKGLKWYQRTIYNIGVLCCVAAIIYTIFLYLRRKK